MQTNDSNPNEPFYSKETLDLHWQMTRCEKYAFIGLLEHIRPKYSLEIGTYKGGSLQVISRYSEKVHCVDINDNYVNDLSGKFENVSFDIGDSKKIVPGLIKEINESDISLSFVLIDGDHSEEGVRSDINNVLQIVPKEPIYIVFHDSFNPTCRKGILSADWQSCEHVHYVEIDYIPGVFHKEAHDTARPKSMWGGLALAIMSPEKRVEPLNIYQSQKGLFDCTYANSSHKNERHPNNPFRYSKSLRRLKNFISKKL
ncbi:MAG: class I SAM-dependent methyltransferase [Cyclobacteriaceae bacterium]